MSSVLYSQHVRAARKKREAPSNDHRPFPRAASFTLSLRSLERRVRLDDVAVGPRVVVEPGVCGVAEVDVWPQLIRPQLLPLGWGPAVGG